MACRTGEAETALQNCGRFFIVERTKVCLTRPQVITCIVALVIIIAVSVSVGVVVGRKNNNSNTRSSTNTGVSNPDAVNQTDPNDPSSFVPDPNLRQAFYGIAYTPVGSQLPDCGNKLGVSAPNAFCSAHPC